MSQSKYEFWKEASLSQKLADKYPDYVQLAGSDSKISIKIQRLKVLAKHGLVSMDNLSLILDLLNGDRMALFATSEKVNEITKMGLQMPKGEDIISEF